MRTYMSGNGNTFKSLLVRIISGLEVSIVTKIVDSDIQLLFSNRAIKRIRPCLNIEMTVSPF